VVGTSCALLDEDAVLVTKVIDGDTLEIKERERKWELREERM